MVHLPNLLSFSRLLRAAAFVLIDRASVRIALIVAASLTDYLDGWLARRRNATTKWGALIDPISDRAFVFAAVSSFLFNGSLTTAQYLILLSRALATALAPPVARTL